MEYLLKHQFELGKSDLVEISDQIVRISLRIIRFLIGTIVLLLRYPEEVKGFID